MPPLKRTHGTKRDQSRKSSKRRPASGASIQRRSDARLELLESLPLASVEWSVKERRILRWSKEATRIFGWTAEETVGQRIEEVGWIHPDDRRSMEQMETQVAAGTAAVRTATRNRNVRKDGAVIHCDWYNSVFRHDSGVPAVLSLVADVSERVDGGDALRSSEERFRAALQDSPVTVAALDRELRYTWIYNPPHGIALEKLLGRRPDELATLDTDTDVAGVLRQVLETGVADTRQVSGTAFGKAFRSQVRAEPCRNASGDVAGLILTLIDLTEQRKAEETLREADRHKNEFLAILSHELRNPLAAIKANLYLLDRVPADSKRHKHSKEVIGRQADHLAMLVDDLLDLTRIARGRMEVNRGRVDLCEIVRTAVADNQMQFEDRGVGMELSLPSVPVLVEADRARMGQVVGNLLHNAAKFTPRGGSARACVSMEGGEALLEVSDDGIGMEPAVVAKVFEPFMQVDTSIERASGGLGLGLPLVKSLVELHGGRVSAASEGLGKGARFAVRLPLAPGAEAVAAGTPVASQRGHRVLVIEDNADLAEALREILQEAGHEVAVAFDGPSGVAKAQELLPEAVFCDIGLPGLNGYEVARKLRACPELAETVLIALSGYAQPEDLRRAQEAGFARHLAKPPRIEAVEALVDGLPVRPH